MIEFSEVKVMKYKNMKEEEVFDLEEENYE